jgi:hypothetical protein
MLDGSIRLDLDMTRMKSTQIPAAAVDTIKQMGMDQLTTVIHPEKKKILLIYPMLHAYAEIPMSKEEAAEADKTFKIERNKIGRETVDGRACEKDNVILTDNKGGQQTIVVWYAGDLRDFPIQMQMPEQGNFIVFNFREVKLVKPEARQFEAPEGLARYDSAEKLIKLGSARVVAGQK